MQEAIEYIKQPKTIRKIIVIIFLMWWVLFFSFFGSLANANYINIDDSFLSGDLVNAQTYQADINFKYSDNDFAGKLFFCHDCIVY